MRVLELYSGIGGMHLAVKASGLQGEIIASIDINTVANEVYKHNFPHTKLLNRNIQSITPEYVRKLKVDTILMSPPCQPFTRNGLKKDTADARTTSFHHILKILPEIDIEYILIENVKGFDTSEMREELVEALKGCGYVFQEYILSPTQLGVPNTRHRYYCLARKDGKKFECALIKHNLAETEFEQPFEISTILQPNSSHEYYIPEKILQKRCKLLDICYANSRRSCCFTKGYGRYVEGTGSVFTDKSPSEVAAAYETYENNPDAVGNILDLKLRFFTPREVCRLMSFPESFNFPPNVSNKQKYMLLGNSINVKVVSELIKILHNLLLLLFFFLINNSQNSTITRRFYVSP